MPGLFIAMEGINGSGKTTQSEILAETLVSKGYQVTLAREPGSTHLGEAVRNIVKSTADSETTPMTQLLLYNAARAQMLYEVTRPALEKGHVVISDRYTASTVAYQGFAQGIDPAIVRQICQLTIGNTVPDLNILLDLPVEAAVQRTHTRTQQDPKLALGMKFQEKVRQGFLHEMANNLPHTWIMVDAAQEHDEVSAAIERKVREMLITTTMSHQETR